MINIKDLSLRLANIKNLSENGIEETVDMFIQMLIEKEQYHLNSIISDSKFISSNQIISADSYNTKEFIWLIEIFGYERVNKIFVQIKDKAQYELKEQENNEC